MTEKEPQMSTSEVIPSRLEEAFTNTVIIIIIEQNL